MSCYTFSLSILRLLEAAEDWLGGDFAEAFPGAIAVLLDTESFMKRFFFGFLLLSLLGLPKMWVSQTLGFYSPYAFYIIFVGKKLMPRRYHSK